MNATRISAFVTNFINVGDFDEKEAGNVLTAARFAFAAFATRSCCEQQRKLEVRLGKGVNFSNRFFFFS